MNYIEYNAVKNHAKEIAALGNSALIVTGRSSAKACGALYDITEVLNESRIKYAVFDRVEENPSIETVMEARDMGIKSGADFVIGIGGGSPMDAAKAIAVMIRNASQTWELLYETEQAGGVPVACVPTTCGTGSEVTAVSVLTRHDLKTKLTAKQKLFPALSLVDPGYLSNAGQSIIRNTSIDAMGHMIESYINNNATEQSREYSLKGLRIWSEIKGYLVNGLPDDAADRRDILLKLATSSNLGGYSIVTPGTSLPHGMSYNLTYEKHVPHGMAVGIFEPGFLELAADNDKKILLDAMGFSDIDEFRTYITACCVRPMAEQYMTKDQFLEIAERSADSFCNQSERLKKLPYPMNREILHDIIIRIADCL